MLVWPRSFSSSVLPLLLVVLLVSSGCKQHHDPGEKPPPDSATTCPRWEERTALYTEKLICSVPGGHICTPNSVVCLEIPPNALIADTKIKVTTSGPEFAIEGANQLDPGARLEPEGLTFRLPVTAVVRPQGAADVDDVSLLSAKAPDQWEELDNIQRNRDTGQVSGELDDFSWLYPFLVGTPGPGLAPTLTLHGGPSTPSFGSVGAGGTAAVGLSIVVGPSGAYAWTDFTNTYETLVLQVDFPSAVAGQKTYSLLTMEDPGPYTGQGRNARQEWRMLVFNQIFAHMRNQPLHFTGPDGVAIYPTDAASIPWDRLPAGYPSGRVTADLQFFDENGTLIATSTLSLSIARP